MKLFSKSFRHQGREALVELRRAPNKTSAFLFVNFFFAPPISKEKVGKNVMQANNLFVYENLSADFSFDEVGAKEKSIKKKSAANGGRRPSTPQAFGKA